MIKSFKKSFLRTAIVFVCLIAFYFVSMVAVYFIPSESIDENFVNGTKVIYAEGEYSEPFFGIESARLDGTTDIIMMMESQQRLYPDMGPVEAAMSINGYSRFWHGYQILLRPALTFMSYRQIRYFNTFLFFILMCLSFAAIKKHISTLTAIFFIATLMMTFSFLAPMNMQYMPTYTIMFIGVLLMLKYKENFKAIYLLFFIIGSVIDFFDFLTFPLITLGLPLAVLYFAREKIVETKVLDKFIQMIKCSVMWGFGYAFTWIAKWALATGITGINIFSDAAKDAQYRMLGNESYILDRKLMYWINVFKFLTIENIIIAIFTVAILVVLIILSRKKFKYIAKSLPIFMVAMYPYCWYFVFGNHSQFHSFFTYRSQMISVFIGYAFLSNAVDFEQIKATLSKIFKKKKATTVAPPEIKE